MSSYISFIEDAAADNLERAEKAEADRDYWKSRALRNRRDLGYARAELDKVVAAWSQAERDAERDVDNLRTRLDMQVKLYDALAGALKRCNEQRLKSEIITLSEKGTRKVIYSGYPDKVDYEEPIAPRVRRGVTTCAIAGCNCGRHG